jgi:hypothetical protein
MTSTSGSRFPTAGRSADAGTRMSTSRVPVGVRFGLVPGQVESDALAASAGERRMYD